jgi:hypothetical protein
MKAGCRISRFLVASPPGRDLLFFAKDLFAMTVPGVGPITALCFKATIDDLGPPGCPLFRRLWGLSGHSVSEYERSRFMSMRPRPV